LFGILNRAHLDAKKIARHLSDAANPLSCLAEFFNDYEAFTPQILMVQYIAAGHDQHPVNRTPLSQAVLNGLRWLVRPMILSQLIQ